MTPDAVRQRMQKIRKRWQGKVFVVTIDSDDLAFLLEQLTLALDRLDSLDSLILDKPGGV